MKDSRQQQSTGAPLNNIAPPPGMDIRAWQRGLRRQAASGARLTVTPPSAATAGYFAVSSADGRSHYRVAYYGPDSEWNYCSCPDFLTNRLGTCKHIEAITLHRSGMYASRSYTLPDYTSVYLDYRADRRRVMIRIGDYRRDEFTALAAPLFGHDRVLRPEAYSRLPQFIAEARRLDSRFRFYGDALRFVIDARERAWRHDIIAGKYRAGNLDGLLNVPLYPYQADGVRFAFRGGRTIIADEMGLGKTVQAIALAMLLRREGLATSVLILCPTSLKHQWLSEIQRFTSSSAILVDGIPPARRRAIASDAFFKITSYNSMARDIDLYRAAAPDLIIYDEIQRLKNWSTTVAKAARRLSSRYVLALSATPLENRLDELYSVMQLVDQYRLGPYYQFISDTTLRDPASARVTGYRNLDNVARALSSVMLRRSKSQIAAQLPPRTDTTLFVDVTPEQAAMHASFSATVARIVARWQRSGAISGADRRRLLTALSSMRMVSDSTFIIDPASRHDTKIDEAINLVTSMIAHDSDSKMVIFSQWERMLALLAGSLRQLDIPFEFLHGSLSSSRRAAVISRFTTDAACRVFLSTDTGSAGLNLQVASTIVSLDLPWNPAILAQRVGRVFRLGQQRPVHVINMISRNTIEQRIIDTVDFKSRLASGVLDGGVDEVLLDPSRIDSILPDIAAIIYPSPARQCEPDAPSPHSPADDSDDRLRALADALDRVLSSPQSSRRLLRALASDDGRAAIRRLVDIIGAQSR